MGLKLECNTRRFVVDDRRELQYRVEVQNRVYRKEMATLDAEIAKLERMLENRSSSTSSSQVSMIPHIKVIFGEIHNSRLNVVVTGLEFYLSS